MKVEDIKVDNPASKDETYSKPAASEGNPSDVDNLQVFRASKPVVRTVKSRNNSYS